MLIEYKGYKYYAFADTHGMYQRLYIPVEADILICAGDACKGFNEREYSNGESGYQYFVDAIQPNGLYLLDEPENSLAADLQLELANYIPGMAKHFNCQFIISTHSPFLLAIPRAKIYDLDQNPVKVQEWTKLHNVQLFHIFFKEHENEFESKN